MASAPAAVVVGAGVVGCGIALALRREGIAVTIVDRAAGPGQGSTSASSAIVRFHYSTFAGVAVAWEAKHHWERWPEVLGAADESGFARYFTTGFLVLDTPGHDHSRVAGHYDRLGIPYEVLDPAALRARFPHLSTTAYFPPRAPDDDEFWLEPDRELGGFYTPEGGFVDDPGLAAHNLWSAATASGARSIFRSEVTGIRCGAAGVTGITLADGQAVDATIVVNAAGPHSAAINELAGVLDDFAVRTAPMRQEVHTLDGPPALTGGFGPTVGDGDLGTYFRSAPGDKLLVGSLEPACDRLGWLADPDEYDVHPTPPVYERQTLRLARRVPSLAVPNRPTGHAGVYDVTDDWIPIYDKTNLPGYFVAIGTSGNQFKNAPVIGAMMAAVIVGSLAGRDHDTDPVHWTAPMTGSVVDLSHYSRLRAPNSDSSNTVLA